MRVELKPEENVWKSLLFYFLNTVISFTPLLPSSNLSHDPSYPGPLSLLLLLQYSMSAGVVLAPVLVRKPYC